MFKALLVYRITSAQSRLILNDPEQLAELLAEKPAYLPEGSVWGTRGFKSATSINDELVYTSDRVNLINVLFHERMLPGATIREKVDERARKIEERESRKCYAKERAQIKDEVVAELLPKAFIKHTQVPMLICGSLLLVCASSVKRAEDCLDLLRSAMGKLSIKPISFKVGLSPWMTDLARGADGPFVMGERAKLVDSEKSVVTVKDVAVVDNQDVEAHLDSGFYVSEAELFWYSDGENLIRIILNEKVIIKGIKFNDILLSQSKADSDGDEAAYFDASFVIFTRYIRHMLNDLIDQVGEDVPKDAENEPEEELAEAAKAFVDNAKAMGADRVTINGKVVVDNLQGDDEEDDAFAPATTDDEDDDL